LNALTSLDPVHAYIRGRLILAAEAIRRLSAAGCFPAEDKVIWPESFDRNLDRKAEGEKTRYHELCEPKHLRALHEIEEGGWLYRIKNICHRKAVFAKAYHPNAGWRRIAWLLANEGCGCSHETARTWERLGIEQIAKMPVVASWRDDAEGG
jgi:hypothetical protein